MARPREGRRTVDQPATKTATTGVQNAKHETPDRIRRGLGGVRDACRESAEPVQTPPGDRELRGGTPRVREAGEREGGGEGEGDQ